jgi:hypothetical protein
MYLLLPNYLFKKVDMDKHSKSGANPTKHGTSRFSWRHDFQHGDTHHYDISMMTLSVMTLSITKFSMVTLGIMILA